MDQGIRQRTAGESANWNPLTWHFLFVLLTLFTLLVQGYHPLAEDGGLYVAGIEWKLDPSLFPYYTEFVREHLRFSLFAPLLAGLVHLTHLSLMGVLFLVNLFSIWLTFYAARQLLRRVIANNAAQFAGLFLLSAWWTLPVAGTSLMLMDPYLTARSLTLPLGLLAMAFAIDDWRSSSTAVYGCGLCLVAAVFCHPLMAAYGCAMILVLRMLRSLHPFRFLAAFTATAILLAIALQHFAPPETPAIRVAEISRDYWYLGRWQWYELLGLAGPLIVIALSLRLARNRFTKETRILVGTCIFLGILSTLIAIAFARENLPTHLVARLQPLRTFVLIYAVLALLLGVACAQAAIDVPLRSIPLRRGVLALLALFFISMAGIMHFVQRESFPASEHLELPWNIARNPNPWVRAFLWARNNTSPDALFALDAKYVNTAGEDAQTFRATALRSALPDYSKDGGEASISPTLAEAWLHAASSQKGLSETDDVVRDERLAPFHATWMILHTEAPTQHSCPYSNSVVKVCRLSP